MPAKTTGAGGVPVDVTGTPIPDAQDWATTPASAAGEPVIAPDVEDPPKPLIPADGFHDTREVAAAEAGNLPTQAGYPLHPAALQILSELKTSVAGIRSWVDHAEEQINRAAAIGAGGTAP